MKISTSKSQHKRSSTSTGTKLLLAMIIAAVLLLLCQKYQLERTKAPEETTTSALDKEKENAPFKIPFEYRVDVPCPNKCSSFLNSSNMCDGATKQCSCGAEFSGADCSFLRNKQCVIDRQHLLGIVGRHYRRVGGYDGISQAHAHIILGNQVLQNKVPGDVVELGVYKGGSSSVLVRVFETCSSKKFWLYDSFAGHPSIDKDKNPGMENWAGKHIGTIEEAKANVLALNPTVTIDDDRIIWRKGFFNETLMKEEPLPTTIAYLHIDCDWYECIIDILDVLYDRVSYGGVIILDDVGIYGFARAGLMEWIRRRNIVPALRSTFGIGENLGGGSHSWVKGYQGWVNQPKEALWPGGATPPVF
jgi:O-methyltransferase